MRWSTRLTNRMAALFGLSPDDRDAILTTLLAEQTKDRPGYWLQLVLSVGLASLGLALGSTAVVIGAMLVSPLMGPIVHLSMGFATGSPYLTIRSCSRLVVSCLVAVLGSAAITLCLPFHELTPQITSRTHPNVLDLAVAIVCAFAVAFTTIRAAAASATAAGTAVGIALVPPLCVAGYAIGVQRWELALGAGLLFTANVCAILFFAGAAFLALGFGSADVRALEQRTLLNRPLSRLAIWLGAIFAGRYSRLLRFLVPLTLLAAVIVPLVHALTQVTQETRIRSHVESLLRQQPARRSVRTSIQIEGRAVTVELVIVGSGQEADMLKQALNTRIAALHTGFRAHVQVVAVPDEAMVQHCYDGNALTRPAPEPKTIDDPPH